MGETSPRKKPGPGASRLHPKRASAEDLSMLSPTSSPKKRMPWKYRVRWPKSMFHTALVLEELQGISEERLRVLESSDRWLERETDTSESAAQVCRASLREAWRQQRERELLAECARLEAAQALDGQRLFLDVFLQDVLGRYARALPGFRCPDANLPGPVRLSQTVKTVHNALPLVEQRKPVVPPAVQDLRAAIEQGSDLIDLLPMPWDLPALNVTRFARRQPIATEYVSRMQAWHDTAVRDAELLALLRRRSARVVQRCFRCVAERRREARKAAVLVAVLRIQRVTRRALVQIRARRVVFQRLRRKWLSWRLAYGLGRYARRRAYDRRWQRARRRRGRWAGGSLRECGAPPAIWLVESMAPVPLRPRAAAALGRQLRRRLTCVHAAAARLQAALRGRRARRNRPLVLHRAARRAARRRAERLEAASAAWRASAAWQRRRLAALRAVDAAEEELNAMRNHLAEQFELQWSEYAAGMRKHIENEERKKPKWFVTLDSEGRAIWVNQKSRSVVRKDPIEKKVQMNLKSARATAEASHREMLGNLEQEWAQEDRFLELRELDQELREIRAEHPLLV